MAVLRRLRSWLGVLPAETGRANKEDPKPASDEDKQEKATDAKAAEEGDAGAKGTDSDRFGPHKQDLRKLTTWIVGTSGTIAATLVVGSQVTELGQLDADVEATLFGITWTRFGFAALSLGIALGTTAFVLAGAVWVQTSGTLTLRELMKFPTRVGIRVLGPRVKAKVRETIEADLQTRQGLSLDEVVAARKRALRREWALRRSLIQFSDAAGMLKVARPPNVAEHPVRKPGDWFSWRKLRSVARSIGLADELREPTPAHARAFEAFEHEVESTYKNAQTESITWDSLLMLVLDQASYLRMRLSFGMMLKYMVTAMFVGGLAIATFAWATHPPDEPTDVSTSVSLVPLSDLGTERGIVTSNCDASTVKVEVAADAGVAVVSGSGTDEDADCQFDPSP